ncbi:MAG: hypothetical protein KDC55_06560 [Ignavibacteriae bacterium]|nr:hypothetical protein [Ignavibacteriota bacterium]
MTKTLKHIALFILSAFVTLLVCELFINNAKIVEASLGKYYEDIGKGLPNNIETVFFNEGFGIFRTNHSRFIGNEVDTTSKNHINIALVGDSFVESFQIFERDYFGNIIEKRLEEHFKGYTFDVLNFGRAGFNISHNFAYQRLLVDQFNPALVLYFVSNGDLHLEKLSPLYPYAKEENDSLVASIEFDRKEIERYIFVQDMLAKSILLNMLKNAKHTTDKHPVPSILFGKVYDWFVPKKKSFTPDPNYKPLPMVNKILSHLDSNVIIINRDYIPFYKAFEDEVNRLGITNWDTSKFMDSLRKLGKDPYYWKVTKTNGHWNQEMHKDIGEFLSKKLIQKIEQDSVSILKSRF